MALPAQPAAPFQMPQSPSIAPALQRMVALSRGMLPAAQPMPNRMMGMPTAPAPRPQQGGMGGIPGGGLADLIGGLGGEQPPMPVADSPGTLALPGRPGMPGAPQLGPGGPAIAQLFPGPGAQNAAMPGVVPGPQGMGGLAALLQGLF